MRRYIVLLAVLCALTTSAYADSMKNIISASGVTGGVAVHLGCGDGESTAKLYSGDKLLVYGLDTDEAAIAKACNSSALISNLKCVSLLLQEIFPAPHNQRV